MALKEIRATLDVDEQYTFVDSASSLRQAFNKRIQLTEFRRHTVQTVQIFHNSFDLSNITGVDTGEVIRHTFVTTYPIAFGGNDDAVGRRVPNASDENVHYRCTEVFSVAQNNVQQLIYSEEWPEKELAGFTNLSFYTPFLYITVLYEVPGWNQSDFYLADPSVSLYMVVDEVDCNSVEYSMGCIAERESATFADLEASGGTIESLYGQLVLNVFPMYRFSRRPQGMLRIDAVGNKTDWYFPMNNLQGEEMKDPTALRSDNREAGQMVNFESAFGRTRLGTFYPDWLEQQLSAIRGVDARVSTNVIPKRQNDDGTTRMFTP